MSFRFSLTSGCLLAAMLVCAAALGAARAQDGRDSLDGSRDVELIGAGELEAVRVCAVMHVEAQVRVDASRSFSALETSARTACRAELAAYRQALVDNGVSEEAVARVMRSVHLHYRRPLRTAFDAAVAEQRKRRTGRAKQA